VGVLHHGVQVRADRQTGTGRKPGDVSPLLRVDDGHLLNLLAMWAPDTTLRKTILVDNPATLYTF